MSYQEKCQAILDEQSLEGLAGIEERLRERLPGAQKARDHQEANETQRLLLQVGYERSKFSSAGVPVFSDEASHTARSIAREVFEAMAARMPGVPFPALVALTATTTFSRRPAKAAE